MDYTRSGKHMFNEELFWFEFGDLISSVILATVIIAQAGFVIWLMIRWLVHNVDFKWSPNLNIKGTSITNTEEQVITKKKSLGPIEVGVKKNFVVDTKLDEQSVKLDEKIKGKVKTQKDKLRSLRK